MLERRRRLVLGAAAVVLAVVLVLLAVRVIGQARRSELDRALGTVPAATLRFGFTDWAAARAEIAPKRVTSARGLGRFVGAAYDRDLSAASSIDSAAVPLQEHYGFSPANARWEAYAQSRQGAVMVLRLDDDVDLDRIADRLSDLGYDAPKADDGVWRGSPELVSGLDPSITPELQNIVLDRDRHLIVSSDQASYAATTQRVVRGDARSLADTDLSGLAGRVQDPVAAFLWRGGFACEDLSLSQAAGDERQQGERLVAAAGGVDSLDGLVETLRPGGRLQVALGFENDDQARANLRPRAKLFVGPAPGRPGSFADDLALRRSRTDGSAVLLDLRARGDAVSPLSTISQGPVIWATC